MTERVNECRTTQVWERPAGTALVSLQPIVGRQTMDGEHTIRAFARSTAGFADSPERNSRRDTTDQMAFVPGRRTVLGSVSRHHVVRFAG